MMRIATLFSFVLFLALPSTASANDEGLYDPLPPAGAAFVRLLNTGAESADFKAGGKTFSKVTEGSVSPYYVVKSGNVGNTPVVAGTFYTLHADKTLTDPAITDPSKALLLLYNFSTTETLSLKTADGKIAIIDSVAKGANGSRAINPRKVPMALFAGDQKLADVSSEGMERGRAYSIFVWNDANGALKTLWSKSVTKTKP